jgi:hypothetical protein
MKNPESRHLFKVSEVRGLVQLKNKTYFLFFLLYA